MSSSVPNLKSAGLLLMIAITVFSLKPAFSRLISAAFVSGPSGCCAFATAMTETHKMAALSIRFMNVLSFARFFSRSDRLPGPCGRALVAIADLLYVIASFAIRRHAVSKLCHCAFARVVTSQHQIDAVLEAIQQLSQI